MEQQWQPRAEILWPTAIVKRGAIVDGPERTPNGLRTYHIAKDLNEDLAPYRQVTFWPSRT